MKTTLRPRVMAALLMLGCGTSSPPAAPPEEDAGADDAGIPCDGGGVSKGPWVMGVSETGARIRFEACRPGVSGDVTLEPEGGGAKTTFTATETASVVSTTLTAVLNASVPPDLAGTWYTREATAIGLAPATCYRYALTADPSASGRFCTARKSGETVRFLAIGDTNPGLGDTTSKLWTHLVPRGFDFTLHLGDIQYYDSGLETWAYWATRMAPMLRQGAFFPSIGNHESEKPTEYAEYVVRYFGNTGLAGTDGSYRFATGGVAFFALDTEEPSGPGSPQAAWFAQELAKAAAEPGYRMSVVFFHRPLITCGDTGDLAAERAFYEPLFTKHKVRLVLQAHMHGYERFELGEITYVTSGGGGGAMGNVDENKARGYCDKRVASGPWFHGTLVEIDKDKLTGTVVDQNGIVLDTFSRQLP